MQIIIIKEPNKTSCSYCNNLEYKNYDNKLCNLCFTKYKTDDCAVCLEKIIDNLEENKDIYINLPCRHWVHKNCQLKSGNNCVICRTKIYNNNVENININITATNSDLLFTSNMKKLLKFSIFLSILFIFVVIVFFLVSS